jgi:hypothetical protein
LVSGELKNGKWLVSGDFLEPLTSFCFQKSSGDFLRNLWITKITAWHHPVYSPEAALG